VRKEVEVSGALPYSIKTQKRIEELVGEPISRGQYYG
jgi:hypothetical protein